MLSTFPAWPQDLDVFILWTFATNGSVSFVGRIMLGRASPRSLCPGFNHILGILPTTKENQAKPVSDLPKSASHSSFCQPCRLLRATWTDLLCPGEFNYVNTRTNCSMTCCETDQDEPVLIILNCYHWKRYKSPNA